MKQAIHIFKKDLRYLWREVLIVLLLTTATSRLGFLFVVAACWMIARLIQAELLVGENQFWITRPYSWKALLGAKVAFIFVFVQLPILLIQLAILIAHGFPLWGNMSGLFWEQLLFWICMSLPLATLSAITSGLAQLILTSLIVPVVGFVAVEFYLPLFGTILGTTLGPLEWVKDTVALGGAAIIAGVVLYFQYRKRATVFSWIFLGGTAALVLAVFICLPWSVAFAVQSTLPHKSYDASSLRIRLAEHRPQFEGHPIFVPAALRIPVRLTVDGVPPDNEIRADAVDLQVRLFDGRIAALKRVGLDRVTIPGNNFDMIVPVNPPLSRVEYDAPVIIRGTIYLTVFGNTRLRTIAVSKKPANVIDSLQCSLAELPAKQFLCGAPFRWPPGIVSAAFSQNDIRRLGQAVSYSPFPAELALNPVEWRSPFGTPTFGPDVTISIKEPLVHLRRDFEFTGIQIANSDSDAR